MPTPAIIAYAAKYASALYGPFREAVNSALTGNRRSYQQDPANRREARREVALDIAEGADLVMVKPAGWYLDVLADTAAASTVPVAAYQISGEYAMVEAAAGHGWIDRDAAVMESLTAIRRAGADVVLTYWAAEVAARLDDRGATHDRRRSRPRTRRTRRPLPRCSTGPHGSSLGGVNSPVRAFRSVGGTPRFMVSGRGPYLTDADGRSYVDLVCSWGPLILGHAHPAVLDAVRRAAAAGLSFGTPTEGEVELAEEIVERIAPVQRVRLVSSGTEATMSAVRLARGFTGRSKIIKFAGCYHGHVDALAGRRRFGRGDLRPARLRGVTAATAGEVIVLPYNDIAAVRAAFDAHPGRNRRRDHRGRPGEHGSGSAVARIQRGPGRAGPRPGRAVDQRRGPHRVSGRHRPASTGSTAPSRAGPPT